ncbi:hypothetical protein E2562_014547 [Oryza meyeriana var. granulata]|uniref:Uncharacterized protein n=1 Tax=Oryza meyeriana var. granulata TaxID=110450 RepID=A0A6G1EI47_9ORYZ|nr:hypothetical protein E2562_014547 [Oryza meyeriana var. granulata]
MTRRDGGGTALLSSSSGPRFSIETQLSASLHQASRKPSPKRTEGRLVMGLFIIRKDLAFFLVVISDSPTIFFPHHRLLTRRNQ